MLLINQANITLPVPESLLYLKPGTLGTIRFTISLANKDFNTLTFGILYNLNLWTIFLLSIVAVFEKKL